MGRASGGIGIMEEMTGRTGRAGDPQVCEHGCDQADNGVPVWKVGQPTGATGAGEHTHLIVPTQWSGQIFADESDTAGGGQGRFERKYVHD